MKNEMSAAEEWKAYLALFNGGATRTELLKFARGMKDKANQRVALRNLGETTPSERREIAARWEAIEATTDREARAHCQFAGLPAL